MNKKDGGKVVIRSRITFLSSFEVALVLILINLALSMWLVYTHLPFTTKLWCEASAIVLVTPHVDDLTSVKFVPHCPNGCSGILFIFLPFLEEYPINSYLFSHRRHISSVRNIYVWKLRSFSIICWWKWKEEAYESLTGILAGLTYM